MNRRFIRPDDELDDHETVVVRGGELDKQSLRDDAERHHRIYGVYAISVLAAREATVDELAQQPPLIRFAALTLTTVGALRAAGFRLEPTGRDRRHFSVCFDALGHVARLPNCEHRTVVNPYHED